MMTTVNTRIKTLSTPVHADFPDKGNGSLSLPLEHRLITFTSVRDSSVSFDPEERTRESACSHDKGHIILSEAGSAFVIRYKNG